MSKGIVKIVSLEMSWWNLKKYGVYFLWFCRVAQNFKHEKFIWDQADSYSLRKRNAEKCENYQNWTTFRYANLRSKFYYITRLRDMGEKGKIDFQFDFHLNYNFIFIIINPLPKTFTVLSKSSKSSLLASENSTQAANLQEELLKEL